MLDFTSSDFQIEVQGKFDESPKCIERSEGEIYQYYNGKRTSVGVLEQASVLKVTNSQPIVNTDRWKMDIETADHIKSNSNNQDYFLDYFKNRNDGWQFYVVLDWFDFTLDQFMISKGGRLKEESDRKSVV